MLLYLIIITFVSLAAIIVPRYVGLRAGKTYYQRDGLEEFNENTIELAKYLKKLLKILSKLARQYAFHFLVRLLYYVRSGTDSIYAWARDRFMKTAIRDKKAVSRFWIHLKEYKQEIDKEKKGY